MGNCVCVKIKSSGLAPGLANFRPRAAQNLQMPHPQDSQGGQMPHSSPGVGAWAQLELTDALLAGFYCFPCMSRTQAQKKFLLIGYIPSSLDCFSITKKLQRVFSSTLHFAWQISFLENKWNQRRAILPQLNSNNYANLVERNLVLVQTLSYHSTMSWSIFLQVLLSSWCSERKVQLYFPRISFACG